MASRVGRGASLPFSGNKPVARQTPTLRLPTA